jgi:ribosome-binding factor A
MMMAYSREQRLSEEIKKIASKIIRDDLRDPRIAPITSVTEVEVTRDLRYATLFISVLGSEEDKKGTIEALNHAKGVIRKEVGKGISSHFTPEIVIKMDESIEQGVKMHQKINEVREREEARNSENASKKEDDSGDSDDQ